MGNYNIDHIPRPRERNLIPYEIQVLNEHLRHTCLLNLLITDHCFFWVIYIALSFDFSFFDHCELLSALAWAKDMSAI